MTVFGRFLLEISNRRSYWRTIGPFPSFEMHLHRQIAMRRYECITGVNCIYRYAISYVHVLRAFCQFVFLYCAHAAKVILNFIRYRVFISIFFSISYVRFLRCLYHQVCKILMVRFIRVQSDFRQSEQRQIKLLL